MGSSISMEVYAAAEDRVGNITEYRSTVYNAMLKAIRRVVITQRADDRSGREFKAAAECS